MALAMCRRRVRGTTLCFIVLIWAWFRPAAADPWDPQGAARAYEEGRQKQKEIAQAKQPVLAQYLECARIFRKAYLRDPHFRQAGDAIYQEARIYQEMGDKFAAPQYYRMALKRFALLVADYGGNPSCPDALLRMGDIYSKNLGDEEAARKAYQHLRTQYRYSSASVQLAHRESAPKPAQVLQAPPQTPPAEAPGAASSAVLNVRYWSTSDYTRVIIDMDHDTKYEKGRLANPDRLYFDISSAKLNDDLVNRTISVEGEFLKQIRLAQYRPDVVRVVLDVSASGAYSVSELHDPFRIVIDLGQQDANAKPTPVLESNGMIRAANPSPNNAAEPSTPPGEHSIASSPGPAAAPTAQGPPQAVTELAPSVAEAKPQPTNKIVQASRPSATAPGPPQAVTEAELPVASANANADKKGEKMPDSGIKPAPASIPDTAPTPKAAEPTSHGDRTLTRMLGLKIGRIVIDPGHGGHDQGTSGPGGLLEKNLVLSLARDLQKLIQEELGAEVVLTRNDDTFVSLEERTAIANQRHADLFISIHANSSRNRSISGVETYYLDFAKTASEREVAARENASTVNNVRDLENLIKKIAQADKSAESRELASLIQKKLYSGARKLLPSAQNRGVRRAPFIVLIGAKMPSVLVEVAFISNPKDERLLNKEANQQFLARALFSGIESYISTLGSEPVHSPIKSK